MIDITNTMSNVHVTSLTGDATTMLTEIKKMEVRLTASIKETRDKEMFDMEERLSNIISTTISEGDPKLSKHSSEQQSGNTNTLY